MFQKITNKAEEGSWKDRTYAGMNLLFRLRRIPACSRSCAADGAALGKNPS